MPIRIRHPDKSGVLSQPDDVSTVMPDVTLVSQASYTALIGALGVL